MSVEFLQGDAKTVLEMLVPDKSVHCVVTSPPYWGLRDYGTAKWEGGDPACDHKQEPPRFNGPKQTSAQVSGHASKAEAHGRMVCQKCGARSSDLQLGLESTPQEYVEKMVEVFREVRRVLRADGTLWLNLGDRYASTPPGNKATGVEKWKTSGLHGSMSAVYAATLDASVSTRRNTIAGGLKPKDLCGIPWRVAFALQADGWWLRQDIIWSKPNPMPESVRDRCTKAHEYIFLLSKNARYYFDADAIAEESIYKAGEGGHQRFGAPGGKAAVEYGKQVSGQIWNSKGTRNKRSVWTVTPKPFKGAHFATFPPDLIEPCILAGCPAGGTVLDPFGGAGTTGLVAQRHGRNAILCELNPEYISLAKERLAKG